VRRIRGLGRFAWLLLAGAAAFQACGEQEPRVAAAAPRPELTEEDLHGAWEHMAELNFPMKSDDRAHIADFPTPEERRSRARLALAELDRELEGRPRTGALYRTARWQRLYAMTVLPESDVVVEGVDLAKSDPTADFGQIEDVARWLDETNRDAEAKRLLEACESLLKK
jgi:hypothetical protein